jgi:ABC-type transport system involved in Fe-S cluster assembly fused permease/ATPase subunit
LNHNHITKAQILSEANTNAVDSLINYETVKYFNRKDFEVNRYDETMGRWEGVATKLWWNGPWMAPYQICVR